MNKENLLKLVDESNFIKDIIIKLGFSINGGYLKVYKLLDENDIDYSRLLKNKGSLGCITRYTLSEILVENSPYSGSGSRLKEKLLKEGLKIDKCEICGLLPKHMNKPLLLQLHHINGNHNDNRLENLLILCPNCHSQTENYAGKGIDRKKHYYCENCGKEIYRGSKLCKKCKGTKSRKVNRPSKEELLQLILTKSFCEIGRMYGVSDNAVRKWCKTDGLPHLKSEIKKLYNS